MGKIILLITSKWRLIIAAMMLASLAGSFAYIQVLKLQKAELATEVKSLKIQLKESQDNVKQLSDSIKTQNTAIDKFKTDADNRIKLHAAELKKAKATAQPHKSRAADIMKSVKPDNVSPCDAANDLFNREIEHVGK